MVHQKVLVFFLVKMSDKISTVPTKIDPGHLSDSNVDSLFILLIRNLNESLSDLVKSTKQRKKFKIPVEKSQNCKILKVEKTESLKPS